MKKILFFTFVLISTSCYSQWSWVESDIDYIRAIFFKDSTHGMISGRYVQLSSDGGKQWFWSQTDNSFGGKLYMLSPSIGLAFSYQITKTTDMGETWKYVTPPGYHEFWDMHFVSDSIGFIVGKEGEIYKTHDQGDTWQNISYSNDENLDFYSVHFIDMNNGWLNGGYAKTTDGGKNWVEDADNQFIFYKSFVNSHIGYGTDRYKLFKTTDSGETWKTMNLPQYYSRGELRNLMFLNENVGYICGSSGLYGVIYKTIDGCRTWSTICSSENSPINCFFFLDENRGWAASYCYVGRTTNGGLTWIKESSKEENQISLLNNYPNPFNSSTKINFMVSEEGTVSLKVYNLLGEVVTTLVNENKIAGSYSINFDAEQLTSGIYYYILNTPNFSATRKMLLIK